MRRPWQVWLVYCLSLCAAMPALVWLTRSTLRLEWAEQTARNRAEREERIRLALWRMDTKLTPLVAQEAGRPYAGYASEESAPAAHPVRASVSPSAYVLLNFEIEQDGTWRSPQSPDVADGQFERAHGAASDPLARRAQLLDELRSEIDGRELFAALPDPARPQLAALPDALAPRGSVPAADAAPASVSDLDQDPQGPTVSPYLHLLQAEGAAGLTVGPHAASAKPDDSGASTASRYVTLLQSPNENSSASPYSNSVKMPASKGSKDGDDLFLRQEAVTSNALREAVQQRAGLPRAPRGLDIMEGASRPIWIGDHLLLARRVKVGDLEVVEGCWLDWDALSDDLRAEVADLLPRLDFLSVREESDVDYAHTLATLPVQLVAPEAPLDRGVVTPQRTSLAIAWAGAIVAAGAVAVLLKGVVALSQRREAFVSAVTHELRTPLTTFRMYAEMLDANMVPSEEHRKEYLHTLHREADRLTHLVENVLAYARLERGRHGEKREPLATSELLARVVPRLADRASQAGMRLEVEADDVQRAITLNTDPTAVEQILFNLVDNACKYAAAAAVRTIHLEIDHDERHVRLRVRDHGPGVLRSDAKRLFQPFSKSAQQAAASAHGVGLGLALCRSLARQMGGELRYEPVADGGALFSFLLPRG